MEKFKGFAEYVRRRMDEELTNQLNSPGPKPTASMQKATGLATAKALRTTKFDPMNTTNVQDMNHLRAKALAVAAKNPAMTAMPNVNDIDATIGVDQPVKMRK